MTQYTDLITSEHTDQPKFVATVRVGTDTDITLQALISGLPGDFDLDQAVGVQLDQVGQWVNRDRYAPGPLADTDYRALLRATIAANQWDGTIPGAYAVWDVLFEGQNTFILIMDHQDMSMSIAIAGDVPSPAVYDLITQGYIKLKPAGVRINYYILPTPPGGALFGFDIENSFVAGFDNAVWAQFV